MLSRHLDQALILTALRRTLVSSGPTFITPTKGSSTPPRRTSKGKSRGTSMLKTASVLNLLDNGTSKWITVGAICVLGLVMRLACTTGLIASDDLGYSHYARLISQYLYVPELHHYAIRYGLIIPVAGVYWLFGVGEWTTILVPLLTSVASVPLLIAIGQKLFDLRTALIAGLLFATFPLQLRLATMLLPEAVAEFYILVAVLVYLHGEGKHSLGLSIASGICVGVAYLTKEPAVFVAPALMIDAAARRQWRAVLGITSGLAVVVAAEHVYYLALTGDLLFRPHAMVGHHETKMALAANENLYKRLLIAYPYGMLLPNRSFGLHSVVALAVIVPGLFLLRADRFRLLILWALLPWLYLNFGSSSLTNYFALPVAPRYIEFVYPPLFLLTGAVVAHYLSSRKAAALLMVLIVGLVSAVGFSCGFARSAEARRTDQVAVLRLIVKRTRGEHVRTVHFVEDPEGRWKPTMAILAPHLKSSPDPDRADIIIRSDAIGLPYVALAVDNIDDKEQSGR
jgi:Dolichyl-phosphate-mannose-protein mannosyltransferase